MKPTKELQQFVNKISKAVEHSYKLSVHAKNKLKLKYIGGGISRHTYESENFPNIVFKIEHAQDSMARTSPNYSEFSFYRKATKVQKKYLAACIFISKDFRVLVMEKTPQVVADIKDLLKFVKKMTKVIPANRRWDTESIIGLSGWCHRKTITPHNIGTVPSGGFKLFDYATVATTC